MTDTTPGRPAQPKKRIARWLTPAPYSSWALVFILALAAACFAWVTSDLLRMAMANTRFFREFGLIAVQHGGLWQLAQIIANGVMALTCWMVFRVTEAELIHRWLGRDNRDEE